MRRLSGRFGRLSMGRCPDKRTGARLGPRYASLLRRLVPARRRLLAAAVAATAGADPSREDRALGVVAALGTHGGVHLTPSAAVSAAAVASAGAPAGATEGTALGLVGVALFGVVLLVVRAERELLAAVLTCECPVFVAHT